MTITGDEAADAAGGAALGAREPPRLTEALLNMGVMEERPPTMPSTAGKMGAETGEDTPREPLREPLPPLPRMAAGGDCGETTAVRPPTIAAPGGVAEGAREPPRDPGADPAAAVRRRAAAPMGAAGSASSGGAGVTLREPRPVAAAPFAAASEDAEEGATDASERARTASSSGGDEVRDEAVGSM